MARITVLIAIQARSTSYRYPGKIFELIGKKTCLQHVVDAAQSSAKHVMKHPSNRDVVCNVAILHPYNDTPIIDRYRNCDDILLIDGPENDVLNRFVFAQKQTNADYIVRLTSDCPMILDYMISKHINIITFFNKDYVANVFKDIRTVADGFDVEVMSAKALAWLDKNAQGMDREHVTTLIRELMPKTMFYGVITTKIDTSKMKISLDTREDLEVIREYYHLKESKMLQAQTKLGALNVYQL